MINDIYKIILNVAEASFVDVTVFVGVVLILFGYINFKKEGKIITAIQNRKRFQPLIGAFLGLLPGCGGAILVSPLYMNGTVTFGTIVATLIATMGDSSFLLITKSPFDFVVISSLTFVIGVVSGYIVDYFKIDEKFNLRKHILNKITKQRNCRRNRSCNNIQHIGHEVGDEICLLLHEKTKGHQKTDTIFYKITHKGYWIYCIVLVFGLMIGILKLFNIEFENADLIKIMSTIGIIGAFGSVILMLSSHKYFSEQTHEEEEMKLSSLKETFIHGVEDTAFVGTWVFAAYFLYEMIMFWIGSGDSSVGIEIMENIMLSSGFYAVTIGALVGMIPGCGPQIIFTSLYLKGLLPIEALIAHSISQDGDALLPVIAMDKRSAVVITILTTIIALVVGIVLYMWL